MTRVAVVYNDDASLVHGEARDAIAVQGVVLCAAAVTEALRSRGYAVESHTVGSDRRAAITLVNTLDCDVVFNLVEAIGGDARWEPAFASLLELSGIPYTGAPARAMTLCLEKPVAQALLAARGIAVPPAVVLERGDEPLDHLPLPAIVKPAREDASHGITLASVAADKAAVRARARDVIDRYRQPAFAEAFVDGREVNVGLLESNGALDILPLAEIDFYAFTPDMPRIVTYDGKWIEGSRDWNLTRVVPARVSEAERERIEQTARAAFSALGLRGYGRVDVRVAADGTPFVIDINPNPDISPDAGFARAAARGGWTYADLITHIVEAAAQAR